MQIRDEGGKPMRQRITVTTLAVCLLIAGSASAEIEIHEKHRFDARPGATVVVDVSFHSVEVTAQPGNAVDVTVDITVKGDGSTAKNVANDLKPVFEEEGNRLIIRSTRKKGWSWKQAKAKGKITIQMPPDLDLSIDSSSGSAEISGDFGDSVVRFDASSGSLTVNGAMGELHSDLSSGSVRASVSRPLKAFTADASSGSVRLAGGAASAKVGTSSGSINVSGLTGDGKFGASSGSIKAQWNAIYKMLNIQKERIKLNTETNEKERKAIEILQKHGVDVFVVSLSSGGNLADAYRRAGDITCSR